MSKRRFFKSYIGFRGHLFYCEFWPFKLVLSPKTHDKRVRDKAWWKLAKIHIDRSQSDMLCLKFWIVWILKWMKAMLRVLWTRVIFVFHYESAYAHCLWDYKEWTKQTKMGRWVKRVGEAEIKYKSTTTFVRWETMPYLVCNVSYPR